MVNFELRPKADNCTEKLVLIVTYVGKLKRQKCNLSDPSGKAQRHEPRNETGASSCEGSDFERDRKRSRINAEARATDARVERGINLKDRPGYPIKSTHIGR